MKNSPHPPGFAFAGSPLDRRSGTRASAPLPQDPANRFVVMSGDRAWTQGGMIRRLAHHELPESHPECVFLGREADGTALFAVAALGEGPEGVADLRALAVQGLLPPDELAILAQARSFLLWHQRHRFCAQCGAATDVSDHGAKRHCSACDTEHFPRTDPVVILTVTHGTKLLLGRGLQFPEGLYSALAGFMEPGETIEEAARRELWEETGIEAGELRYVASQPWPFPSSLMIGLIGTALNTQIKTDPTEIADARWFSKAEAEALLAGNHPENLIAPKPYAIAHHLVRAALATM
jgi:NAD+ diphosphatase